MPLKELKTIIKKGHFFLKIKIGADPDKDGDMEKMLEWDKQRIASIHKAIGNIEVPHTAHHKIPYYFDANGRYDNKDRLADYWITQKNRRT